MARILIAEDTPATRQLLSAILVEEGHSVQCAEDGEKAVEMMRADPPDVLILDIMMPRLDGYGVLRQMKGAHDRGRIRILVLTAKAHESDWVKGFRLGADAYLTKPFEVDELVAAVDEVLAATPGQLAARREQELDKAQLLSRLEAVFEQT